MSKDPNEGKSIADLVRDLEQEEEEKFPTPQIKVPSKRIWLPPTYMADDLDDRLYDDAGDGGGLYDLELNDGLLPWEQKEAEKLATMTRGVMLVTGRPGGGKSLFSNVLAWKVRRYYKGKKVLLDYRPRKLFDMYGPQNNKYFLFNMEFMDKELDKMGEISGVNVMSKEEEEASSKKSKQTAYDRTKEVATEWAEQNKLLLHNGVLVLNELKKYFHNRKPFNRYGAMLGGVITTWRHLDLLLIGGTPFKGEIDIKAFLNYVTHHVKCSWSGELDAAVCKVFKINYVGQRGVINVTGKPKTWIIDGSRPRPELGGMRYYDLWYSKNITDIRPK